MEACAIAPEKPAPRPLLRPPSWLTGQAAIHAQRLVTEAIAAEGQGKPHFTMLVAVDDSGPMGQAALGRRLSIDGSDMVAVLADLEREEDRRRNVVRLTPAGERTPEHHVGRSAR
jgi:DNA-binding MarR family transcriptional regulator